MALGADAVNPVTEDGESIPALSSGGAEPHSTPLKNTPQTPHTPAPKIPLAQLVHFDDEKFAPGGTQVNTSPEDRIVWQSGTPRPALAGKKRGVQDSPVDLSSPAPKKRRDPISTTKTPMDDPASQLWKKYSGTGAKPRAGGDPTARLFQGANRSPSTFRRAYTSPGGLASGSRLKRRKTTPFDDSNNEEAFKEVTDDAESTGSRMGARKARVHLLMTEVKKKMDTPEMSDDVPMPSSMPEVDELALPSSPLRPTSARVAEAKVDKATTENTTLNSSDGEEFGDFDVDMDDLAEIDHIASTQQVKLDPVSAPNILPIEAKAAPLPLFKESGIKMHDDEDYGLDDDDDDYGDDDIFGGDEIDNLMASIEEPSSTKSVPYVRSFDYNRKSSR